MNRIDLGSGHPDLMDRRPTFSPGMVQSFPEATFDTFECVNHRRLFYARVAAAHACFTGQPDRSGDTQCGRSDTNAAMPDL